MDDKSQTLAEQNRLARIRSEMELDEISLTYGVHPEAMKRIRELFNQHQTALTIFTAILAKKGIT